MAKLKTVFLILWSSFFLHGCLDAPAAPSANSTSVQFTITLLDSNSHKRPTLNLSPDEIVYLTVATDSDSITKKLNFHWDDGFNEYDGSKVTLYYPENAGLWKWTLRISDNEGNQRDTSFTLLVNSTPVFSPYKLASFPSDSALITRENPTSPIDFAWYAADADPGANLSYIWQCMQKDSILIQKETQHPRLQIKDTLPQQIQLQWRVIVIDNWNARDTSKQFHFSIQDASNQPGYLTAFIQMPDPQTDSLFIEGWFHSDEAFLLKGPLASQKTWFIGLPDDTLFIKGFSQNQSWETPTYKIVMRKDSCTIVPDTIRFQQVNIW